MAMLWKKLWKKIDAIFDGAAFALLVGWGVASILILLGDLMALHLFPYAGGAVGFCAGVMMKVVGKNASVDEYARLGHTTS